MNSATLIVGLGFLLLVVAFFLFKSQVFIMLNRFARIQSRGVKNLQYTDQDIEQGMDQDTKPELPIQSWLGIPTGKFIGRIIIFVILSFLIYFLLDLFSRVLVQLGNAEFSAGYEKIGIATYNLALEFNRDLKETVNECYAYNTQQEYELAISSCSKAIRIDPNYAVAYSHRGYAYLKLKKYDQAIADFSKDIELIPVDTRSYINRGTVYMEQNQNNLAIAEFTKSIDINPNEPQSWLNRGLAHIKTGQSDLAIVDCNKAIELGAEYYNEYMCLGLAFTGQQKYGLAIANFAKAIDIAPNTMTSTLYCWKGIAYAKNGDFESAIASLEQGLQLDVANDNDWCKTTLENVYKGIVP